MMTSSTGGENGAPELGLAQLQAHSQPWATNVIKQSPMGLAFCAKYHNQGFLGGRMRSKPLPQDTGHT